MLRHGCWLHMSLHVMCLDVGLRRRQMLRERQLLHVLLRLGLFLHLLAVALVRHVLQRHHGWRVRKLHELRSLCRVRREVLVLLGLAGEARAVLRGRSAGV